MKKNRILPGMPYDVIFPKLILSMKRQMEEGNDDCLLLFTGNTGSGKSNLMQWGMTVFSPNPDYKDICITKESFALRQYENTIRSLEKKEKDVQLGYDEAGITAKKHSEKYVKEIEDLYMINRAAKIMHYWCWPRLKGISKTFMEERIRGIFFIFTKTNNKPRKYVFYTKHAIMRMLDEGIELTSHNLKSYRKKYGYYVGMFRKYSGPLEEGYAKTKTDSIVQISRDFANKYGGLKHEEAKNTIEALRAEYGPTALRTYVHKNYGVTISMSQAISSLRRNGYADKVPANELNKIIDDLRVVVGSFRAKGLNKRAIEAEIKTETNPETIQTEDI